MIEIQITWPMIGSAGGIVFMAGKEVTSAPSGGSK